MRHNLLIAISEFAAKKPIHLLVMALIVTLIAAASASKLELVMHVKNLMPEEHPMIKEFNQIIDDYSTASMIIIAARGEEDELKQFADEIAPRVKALKKFVNRVDYKLNRDFFLKHGMMLQKTKDLKNSKDIYSDLSALPFLTHLNDSFEKTYVYDSESISTKEKENNAVAFIDGIQQWLQTMELYVADNRHLSEHTAEKASDRFLLGDPYYISQDKDMLLLFAQPTFTVMEVDKVVESTNQIDAIIAEVASNYPSIFAGTTGAIALNRDEMEAISSDMYFTSIIALVLILALFIISFRMWVAPLLAGLTLLIGIIWTAGFATITVGSLNIMTSMFSVILIGLGVDFSIHIISVYSEGREAGESISQALKSTLLKSGNGIITGGLTTACAFLTLTVSDSVGMKEFGIVAGSGVFFCMLAAILVLPAMLSLRDRSLEKLGVARKVAGAPSFRFLGRFGKTLAKYPLRTIFVAALATIALGYSMLQITFDYNYLNMEPVGLTSIKLQHEMEEEFDATPDFALITTGSIEESRRIAEAAKDLKMIGMVTSISEYVPSESDQQERLPILKEIRASLQNNRRMTPLTASQLDAYIEQLHRLEDNIIELAQLAFLGGQDKVDKKAKQLIGDLEAANNQTEIARLVQRFEAHRGESVAALNQYHNEFASHFRDLAVSMSNPQKIGESMLPDTIREQFINKRGDKYLVTIYPKEQVWDLEFLERFTTQMHQLDPRITGLPSIIYVLMDIIAADGKLAAGLTLLVIFVLLLWDFRKLSYALMAMVPLIVGAIWMIGTMHLFGLQLTMMNVIGLPLILGIGIDDGVHILHRYRIEGRGKVMQVFSSTGKAVLLTSVTTMLAFGSLLFATYRGMGSLGIALFIGVGACFLTSIIVLPAIMGMIERKQPGETKQPVEQLASSLIEK